MKKPTFKKPAWLDAELKLPSFGGSRPRAPKTNVKPPKFASDLYADLRDRRLLPLVALLIVAIIAVPFLLAGGGEDGGEPPVSPAVGQEGGEAAAASFTVVPSEPGLRDYRRRLRHRQPRNPFAQPSPRQSGNGGAAGAAAGGAGAVTVTGGDLGGGSSEEASSGDFSSGGSAGGGGSTTTTNTSTDVVVENTITGYELEAREGFLGDLKERQAIKPMTTLPSEKNPVLVFVGLSEDKKGAIFLMDSYVTAYYGKAKCVLDEVACSTVELRPGKSATFAVGFGKTRYKLTLQKIKPVIEHRADADTVTETETKKKQGEADGG